MPRQPAPRLALALALASSAIAAGCSTPGSGPRRTPTDDAAVTGDAPPTGDAATTSDAGATRDGGATSTTDANCPYRDELDFRTPQVGDCFGRIAEHVFRRAVCSCTDVIINGGASNGVFSYDSRLGPYAPSSSAAGASVGADGSVTINGGSVVEGTVTAAGSVSAPGASSVHGDVIAGGDVSSGQFGHDVHAGGDVQSATIARDLVQSPGRSFSSSTVGGERITCDVHVAPPCPCAPTQLLDVQSFVTDAATHNDDAATGFDPAVFGSTTDVTLPAGRLYVGTGVSISGDHVSFHVTGDTQLFVDGALSINGVSVTFDVAPDASLDVFVGTDLDINGVDNAFGNATHPAHARIYVGRSFVLNGVTNVVNANVYAPMSDAVLNGDGNELFGAIFAHDVTINGANSVYYDSSISEASGACPAPDPTPNCTRCSGCDGSQACVGGACGGCRSDADCCQPLVCNTGRCVPLLI